MRRIDRSKLNPTDQLAYDIFELNQVNGLEGYEPRYLELMERLAGIAPFAEKARVFLTNSGTEANLMAISLARVVTGRPSIAVMRSGYHGGLLYFTDLHGKPIQEYWHFMKFWWPHNEAEIATLLAFQLTGEAKYAAWHALVHDFYRDHRCSTPLFPELPREFIQYLQARDAGAGDPPWLLELAHYEWVELALDLSEASDQDTPHLPDGDLLDAVSFAAKFKARLRENNAALRSLGVAYYKAQRFWQLPSTETIHTRLNYCLQHLLSPQQQHTTSQFETVVEQSR